MSPADARVGTELAGYRIESLLGRGGMSVVYLAEHLRLARKVALKVMAPELAENEAFRKRFVRESRAAAAIDHPNIIPIYDADEVEGVLFIAMRYVQGYDLGVLLREMGRLDPTTAVSIVSQTASALDAAHSRGLVHRDVKPANILIASGEETEAEGHVYLADFGVTKRTLSGSGLTHTGQFVGTIDYVAPEQVKGDAVDGRTDQYSLACVLFESLAGVPPFERDTEVAVLWGHVQEPPPAVTERSPDLPAGLDAVMQKALAKTPAERFATCREFTTAAAKELGVSPGVSVVTPRVRRRRALPLRRRRRSILAAGVAAVVAAVAAIVFVLSGGGGGCADTKAVGSGGVVRIDFGGTCASAAVQTGLNASSVSWGQGAVWVGNLNSGTVSKIDPTSAMVLTSPGMDGDPIGVAAGEGGVWVANGFGSTVVDKVDPPTGQKSQVVSVPDGSSGIATGGGYVWVSNGTNDEVLQIDPSTNSRVAGGTIHLRTGSNPGPITEGGGFVWVGNTLGNSVSKIAEGSHQVVGTFPVLGSPTGIAFGDGSVWVALGRNDQIVRLDPGTGHVAAAIKVGNDPAGVALGGGFVWVANSQSATVSKIDPKTNKVVETVMVGKGNSPEGVAAASDAVWVAVHPQ